MSDEPMREDRLPGDPHPEPKTQAFIEYVEMLDEATGQRGHHREMLLEKAQVLFERYLGLFLESR